MPTLASCLYLGEVVHLRLRPVRHKLRYRVFNLFADIDELPQLAGRLRLFSYNRFNLFSVYDRDHGHGDGTPVRDSVWDLVKASGAEVSKIFMFCYPRVLGYVFNPLTVYYGFDSSGGLRLMIYEVNNTFGERHTYVMPVGDQKLLSCNKEFYVSPFNKVEGRYDFAVDDPGDRLKLSIVLKDADGPCMSTWFDGVRVTLNDGQLLRSFIRLPLLPLKIIAGIHWEAVRLWFKGLRTAPRPSHPKHTVSVNKLREDTK